jgi:hypothetical protein
MLILLEGLDRTGKTTLAGELSNELDAPVIHKGAPKADVLTEYLAPLTGYVPGGGANLVLDRWHWGEVVWPRIYGRRPSMSDRSFAYIERALIQIGAVMVHCTGDVNTVCQRIADTEPAEPITQFGDWPYRVEIAAGMFDGIARRSLLPTHRYDFGEDDFDFNTAVLSIIALARGSERMARKAA